MGCDCINNYSQLVENPPPVTTDFVVTSSNRSMVGFKDIDNEYLIIPETFTGDDGVLYKVVELGKNAFYNCKKLKHVVLPSTIKIIGENAFYLASSLASVNIPDGVTTIGHQAFCGTVITSIKIPDSVSIFGDAVLAYCELLTTVRISNNMKSITDMTFFKCISLTTITIPSNIETIVRGAFSNCTNLQTININKPEGSISGAPWLAPSTVTVNWLG